MAIADMDLHLEIHASGHDDGRLVLVRVKHVGREIRTLIGEADQAEAEPLHRGERQLRPGVEEARRMGAFTSMYCPARKAVTEITSSVRFPSVALSSPPNITNLYSIYIFSSNHINHHQ